LSIALAWRLESAEPAVQSGTTATSDPILKSKDEDDGDREEGWRTDWVGSTMAIPSGVEIASVFVNMLTFAASRGT
jgi:hypothetical protein